MTTRTFGDLTFWHHLQPITFGGGWDPGWRPTDGAFSDNIARADPYWGEVLQRARAAYGDPNMRFDTDDPGQDRHLVFGDGTRVPADGSLAYHDAASATTYLLNTDGSVSPVGAAGQAGDPIQPAGLRRGADAKLAPIDASGHQIAPLIEEPTPSPHGYHDQNGVLTPKNAAGDYYVLGPDGHRQFFDRDGRPVDADRFAADGTPAAAQTPPPLPTDEQQSGQAADAVRKLQDELRGTYGTLSAAEERLSTAMLNAHATTVDGRQQLGAIQHDIVTAVNDPSSSLDTPAGQQAYLKFLRDKVSEIRAVIDSGTLAADDQAGVATALAELYADGVATDPPTPAAPAPAPDPAPAAAPVTAPGVADPGATEVGSPGVDLGSAPAMPDPTLSDVLGGPLGGLGGDPMSAMASMLPGALGGLGGLGGGLGGGDPFGLGGLSGAASPLARLAPAPSDRSGTDGPNRDRGDADTAQHGDAKTAADPPPGAPPASDQNAKDAAPQPQGEPGQGAPPAAADTPPVPTSTVALPDGSSTNAKTPALAGAVRAYLSGTTIDEAYRQAGMALPPPGTPVTNPADPAHLSCGYLGMFTDRYVVAASGFKAFQDGQIVPLSSVASSPDFLGWIDPTTLTAAGAAAPAPPPPVADDPPAPAS